MFKYVLPYPLSHCTQIWPVLTILASAHRARADYIVVRVTVRPRACNLTLVPNSAALTVIHIAEALSLVGVKVLVCVQM